jgi:hypothetical protein
MPQKEALLRWRLCLGTGADGASAGGFTLKDLGIDVPKKQPGVDEEPGPGNVKLGAKDLRDLDASLDFIYGHDEERSAGLGSSSPYVNPNLGEWLSNLRKFFRKDVVALVQKDAIEKRHLTQLLFEPETLPYLEKNVELAATLVAAKDLVPSKAKAIAREVIAEIVEKIRKDLEAHIRQVVLGALARNRRSALPVYRNIDWRTTVRRNMKNYDPDLQRIIPERVYFWANQRKFHEWQVVLVVDQSGSMAASVVYSSVMAAIFASLPVLKTNLVLFDTEVVDMTDELVDPVDVLFGAQLGGGTDIAKALSYSRGLVEQPEKTIFVLISDLYEGGSSERMVSVLKELKEAKAHVLCLLALSDTGRPSYDHNMAATVSSFGVPAFACTPRKLADVMARILKGLSYDDLATDAREVPA